MTATGWLRGTVKEVVTGDTLVIVGASKGVPPEKRITLSSVIAPRLGKRDGSSGDEPFAWNSREFLRNKLIGKAVVFRVDYVVEQLGIREFGSVFLEQENVALSVLSNGWAKVRSTGMEHALDYCFDMQQAEAGAREAGKGVWTKDPVCVQNACRQFVPEQEFNAEQFLASTGKGKPVPAVVEQVLNGSTLRVCLLPSHTYAVISVCGVMAPNMGRRVAGAGASDASPSAADALSGRGPEPLAREAKYFTEQRALSREVRLVIEGVDKHSNLLATVLYPGEQEPVSLAEELVHHGYAKTAEWSLACMASGSQKLREAERAAKVAKVGMWHNHIPTVINQAKFKQEFAGKVIEVVSGDCVVVKDRASGIERRINLSSVRAPRMGTRDRAPDAWGLEARECLRKALVGKEVHVAMEYSRKVPVLTDAGLPTNETERVLEFGHVGLADADPDSLSASEMVVAAGLATVIKHRSDEERSKVYLELMELEQAAKAARKGLHSNKEPPPCRINDISIPGNAAKAKQHLPFLLRAGKMQGVVEYVMSGHRLKVQIPKQGVSIAFAPSGVKCPHRAQAIAIAGSGRPAAKGEPYAEEALSFTREHMMQRNVEIAIETVDKVGTFLGTITIPGPKPFSLSLALLNAGLAKLQPYFDPALVTGGHELVRAAEAAQKARQKVWEHHSEEQDDCTGGNSGGPSNGHTGIDSNVMHDCSVTDVTDGSDFFVQLRSEARLGWLAEQLGSLRLADTTCQPHLVQGQLCLAKFTLDDQWYRGYIEKVYNNEPRAEVYFMDFGNKERLDSRRVAPLSSTLAAVPAQAQPCELAGIKLPHVDSDWYPEANAYFSQLVGGGVVLQLQVLMQEQGSRDPHPGRKKGKWAVILTQPGECKSINCKLLEAGMARVPNLSKLRNPAIKALAQSMLEHEEAARKAHRGMFQYGDPGDSDDEPLAPAPRKPTRK